MEGALCHCSSLELGFSNFTLQEWRRGSLSTRGMLSFAAQGQGGVPKAQRLHIAQAETSGYDRSPGYCSGGRVGFNDVYRRGDSGGLWGGDRGGSSERRLQSSRDGEVGRRETVEASGSNSSVELASHVDIITSVQNPYVKHLVKLRTNTNYRNAAGCVVVVGSVPLRYIDFFLYSRATAPFAPVRRV